MLKQFGEQEFIMLNLARHGVDTFDNLDSNYTRLKLAQLYTHVMVF